LVENTSKPIEKLFSEMNPWPVVMCMFMRNVRPPSRISSSWYCARGTESPRSSARASTWSSLSVAAFPPPCAKLCTACATSTSGSTWATLHASSVTARSPLS
jgi:hypothetical protein